MTRFLPIVLMVMAALGAGLVLVPSAWELASMKLRDKEFAAAERAFEDKFLAGNRSREVVLPLSELYVRNGRVDKAISVLTKFTQVHQNDRDVVERLAELLKEAQDTPRAIATLERLAKDKPDPAALRELDRQYDIAQDMQGRIRTLTRLVRKGSATVKESYTLTALLASTGQPKEALTIAYNAIESNLATAPHELVQTFAALALDNRRPDLIADTVQPWGARQAAAAPLNAVSSALIDKGAPKSAIAMVRASMAFKNNAPDAVVLLARLEADHGDKAVALDLLETLRRAHRLPPTQDSTFVVLALGQKRTDSALAHIWERGYANFDDATLLYAIAQGALERKTNWLKELDKAIDAGARPLPAARIALALGDPLRAASLAKAAEMLGPSVTLAQLYAELGDLPSAARVFDAVVTDASAVTTQELAQATAAAIALKRPEMALALAERLVVQDKGTEATIQRTRALTLNGRATEALDILAALKSTTDLAELAEIEALSAAKRFAELRAKLIAKLSDAALTQERRTNVIFMLNDLKIALGPAAVKLADGLIADLDDKAIDGPSREARLTLLAKIAPVKALPYFKAAALADPDKQGYAYTKLLKDLKRGPELKSFLLIAARTAKAQKVRDDFLFELIKRDGGREALPLLAERANSNGAQWFFAYDEALARHGTKAERLAALQAFADRPATPRQMRSQIAFQILELGDKARAEVLFRALAENSAPNAPEVRQLAFLWGPRPNADARAWLKSRAANAPPQDRAAWAALLLNAGDAKSAESLLTDATDARSVATRAGIYAETRNKDALRTLVKSALSAADGDTARALAEAADALSLSPEASRAYERAGMLGRAGRAAFFAGDLARALSLLETAKPSAETAFYRAETLTALRRPREAATHYRAALAALDQAPEARKMRIVALARLKDHAAAERELAAQANELNDADDARDAYTGALLDQGDTQRAARQLGL